MPLFVITGNSNKFKHIQYLIPQARQLELDLPEIQEIDSQKIIEAKLEEARKHYAGEFLVEDVSFAMDCLNGLPGPLIKWFLATIGDQGLADLAERFGNPQAKVTISVGYSSKNGESFFSSSSEEGIVVKPRGKAGFGWNTIFVPNGHDKTYAEIKEINPTFNTIREKAYGKILPLINMA